MLNGRNFQQLATLIPGVSSVNGTNQQVNSGYLGQTDLIVGGISSEQTTYTIDGVYNMTPTSLININITPSIDTINEFRVLKNAYSAKYGFAGSGQVLIETKAGHHDLFHGSRYEYLRSNSFAVARPYAISRHTPLQQLAPPSISSAFILAGPSLSPRSTTPTAPKPSSPSEPSSKRITSPPVLNSRSFFTPAIRAGDLSLSHDAPRAAPPTPTHLAVLGRTSGTSTSVKYLTCDSFCQSLLSARGLSAATCFRKDANVVTNQLNTTCFDSASKYFIDPATTSTCRCPTSHRTTTPNFANYINTNPELDSQNDTFYRVDQHFGLKHVVTGRYMHEEVTNVRPARNYNDPAPNPGASVYTPALNAMVRWNYTITPSIINSAGLAYTYQEGQPLPHRPVHRPRLEPSRRPSTTVTTASLGVTVGNFWSWLGVGVQPNFSKTGDGVFSDDLSYGSTVATSSRSAASTCGTFSVQG